MIRFAPALLAIALASPLAAQPASLRGAVSGFVFDPPSRTIRPLVGVPGSSYLGKPVLKNIDAAYIAPDGQSALVVENGKAALIRGLQDARPAPYPLGLQVDLAAWASNSSGLVVYSSSTRTLKQFDVSGTAPVAGPSTDLSGIDGDVIALATNTGATRTVIALYHSARSGFYVLTEGAVTQIAPSADPGAIAFSGGDLFYAIDRAARQVLRLSAAPAGAYETLQFAAESAPLTDPIGLALSPDRLQLYLAGASDRAIRQYDLQSRQIVAEIALDAAPRGLSALADGTVLILGPRATLDAPMWLAEVRNTLAVYFVPPPARTTPVPLWHER